MIQRILDVFWPHKWKAALAAIFSFVLAYLLFQGPLAIFGVVALIYGLWYSGVGLYKFNRDRQLADQAQAQVMQPPQQVQPTRAMPESSQFFVPPPHPGER